MDWTVLNLMFSIGRLLNLMPIPRNFDAGVHPACVKTPFSLQRLHVSGPLTDNTRIRITVNLSGLAEPFHPGDPPAVPGLGARTLNQGGVHFFLGGGGPGSSVWTVKVASNRATSAATLAASEESHVHVKDRLPTIICGKQPASHWASC